MGATAAAAAALLAAWLVGTLVVPAVVALETAYTIRDETCQTCHKYQVSPAGVEATAGTDGPRHG